MSREWTVVPADNTLVRVGVWSEQHGRHGRVFRDGKVGEFQVWRCGGCGKRLVVSTEVYAKYKDPNDAYGVER